MPAPDGLRMYILTCPARVLSGVAHATLASVARSDWGDEPVIHLDDAAGGDPKARQTNSYRRLVERVARERPAHALILEDDVAVNRHLRHNLRAWQPVRDGAPFLGSLYNPNLRALPDAPAMEHGFVADPESVYGSQAFVLTPEVADYCLEHWDDVAALQDIRVSRLAARMDPHGVRVHGPSLVEHAGAALSTHGGAQHTSTDFDPWWRAGGGESAEPLAWDGVPGWFDWPDFYREQVRTLPHGAVVVEVGSFLGRSMIFLAQEMKAARKDLRLHAVDTFVGSPSDAAVLHAVERHGGSLRATFEHNLAAAGVDDVVTVVPETSMNAACRFPDRGVDLVFLDGDHAEDAVALDLLAWLPKVRLGGMIAGHDIDTYPSVARALGGVLGRGRYRVDHAQNLWWYRKDDASR
ncbi:MAG TPA: class I SAM-dependent methyltransferase [Longimicrobium sp.]|nr:class I SAM-dependent methyltransferase [Longimicrobium sp.]